MIYSSAFSYQRCYFGNSSFFRTEIWKVGFFWGIKTVASYAGVFSVDTKNACVGGYKNRGTRRKALGARREPTTDSNDLRHLAGIEPCMATLVGGERSRPCSISITWKWTTSTLPWAHTKSTRFNIPARRTKIIRPTPRIKYIFKIEF